MSKETWHRHFGVYGICTDEQQERLLVIRKTSGPYRGRYDLPGGSLQGEEGLVEALQREFVEETGATVEPLRNLGVWDVLVPYAWKETTHTHHMAALYHVQLLQELAGEQALQTELVRRDGKEERNDSDGAVFVEIAALTEENASPLVQMALEWLKNGTLPLGLVRYERWKVLA